MSQIPVAQRLQLTDTRGNPSIDVATAHFAKRVLHGVLNDHGHKNRDTAFPDAGFGIRPGVTIARPAANRNAVDYPPRRLNLPVASPSPGWIQAVNQTAR